MKFNLKNKLNNSKIILKIKAFFSKSWAWLRRTIIRMPASEAETVLMSLAMILLCVWFVTFGKLVITQYIVDEKVKIIKEQSQVIEKYQVREKTIRLPGKVKVVNVTYEELQEQVQQARNEAADLRREKQHYYNLIRKYNKPIKPSEDPAERVKSEEEINDQFIKDWKSAQ